MFWRGFYLPSSIFISSFAGAPSPTGDAVLSPGGVRQLHQMRVAGPLQLKIVYSTPFCAIPVGSCGHKRQQSICQTFWEEVTVAVLPRRRVFQRLLLLPFLLQSGDLPLPLRAKPGHSSLLGAQAAAQMQSSEERSERSGAYIKPASWPPRHMLVGLLWLVTSGKTDLAAGACHVPLGASPTRLQTGAGGGNWSISVPRQQENQAFTG